MNYLSQVKRFAKLALECICREYPNCNQYFCEGEREVKPPHQLTPAFYGCLDWHSAVHNHWLLVRLLRCYPDGEFCAAATEAIANNLTPENIFVEADYLQRKPHFEVPYGLAWLLQLTAELREWKDTRAQEWLVILLPLEEVVRNNLYRWLSRLDVPARIGTHRQTAFALSLIWDWEKTIDNHNPELGLLVEQKGREYYLGDRSYPWAIEPLGADFLSPTLAEADFMRRLLPPVEFAEWLSRFLPDLSKNINMFEPVIASDRSDYQQSHLDGLNLSRAWMLEGIISALPESDRRREFLQTKANLHRQLGLAAVTDEHYAGSHWLGSFAVYLTTRRGILNC